MDLEPVGASFPGGVGEPGRLPRGRARGGGGPAAVRRGDGGGAAQAERGRTRLLEDGYWGVAEWVGELGGRAPAGGDGAALGEALNYFAGHQGRLNYALRLRRGQSIGSGLIEGTIKQVVNRRLKQTGARWKVGTSGPWWNLRPGGWTRVASLLEELTLQNREGHPR